LEETFQGSRKWKKNAQFMDLLLANLKAPLCLTVG
jgi:hypothetical protein